MDGGEARSSDNEEPLHILAGKTELDLALQQLRCVFVTIAPLLSSIIAAALARRVDFRLLAQLDEREGLAARLEALSPDLVVIGLGPQETDELGAALLAHLLKPKILLISATGDQAYLHEMVPHRGVLTDFSPETLLRTIL